MKFYIRDESLMYLGGRVNNKIFKFLRKISFYVY
jgi:hypothetical protein